MVRHSLTDAQWARLQPLLPEERPKRPGRPWRSHRQMIDAILWVLMTGSPWRDLPPEPFGPWITAFSRFNRWRAEGLWDRIGDVLLSELEADDAIDWELWCIDGSSIRAQRSAAGARKKRGPQTSPKTTRSVVRVEAGGASCT